jgi:hypothetical protein
MLVSKLRGTLQRQRRAYAETHGSVANLLIHAVAVPVFWGGNGWLLVACIQRSVPMGAIGLALTAASLAAQACGHRLEAKRPERFLSIGDAVARIFFEQWVTFPLHTAGCVIERLSRQAVR